VQGSLQGSLQTKIFYQFVTTGHHVHCMISLRAAT
jgi:hypothetical protein